MQKTLILSLLLVSLAFTASNTAADDCNVQSVTVDEAQSCAVYGVDEGQRLGGHGIDLAKWAAILALDTAREIIEDGSKYVQ